MRALRAKMSFLGSMALSAAVTVSSATGIASGIDPRPDDAREMAERWVDERGWALGWSREDARLVMIESASVSQPPTSPAFHEARSKAFETAFSRAR